MKTLKELREKRAAIIADLRALVDGAGEDGLSDEQQAQYDERMAEADKLAERIASLERLEAAERQLSLPVSRRADGHAGVAPAVLKHGLGDKFSRALCAYVRSGDERAIEPWATREEGGVGVSVSGAEERASNATDMNIGTGADGQYAVPTGFYGDIVAKRTELNLADKLGLLKVPGKGTTVNVPYDNETDGEFVATNEAGTFDMDAPAIGQASLTLAKYSKYIYLSDELLNDEDANLMAFLMDWVARGQAKTMNNLLLTEVATNGTSLKTTASATAIAAGEPEGVVGNNDLGYFLDDSVSVAWAMRPATYWAIASITGSDRLYAENPAGSRGDRSLLGYPVHFTGKAGAITASQKSAYFGNWNYVGWREGPGFTMLRDPYSKAVTGQLTLWMYFRVVFKVLQPTAIGYLIQHA